MLQLRGSGASPTPASLKCNENQKSAPPRVEYVLEAQALSRHQPSRPRISAGLALSWRFFSSISTSHCAKVERGLCPAARW
jgi:hypothetical protein